MFAQPPLSIAFAIALSALFSIVLPQIIKAETARMEIYSLETLTYLPFEPVHEFTVSNLI